jgi:hypothetical protein
LEIKFNFPVFIFLLNLLHTFHYNIHHISSKCEPNAGFLVPTMAKNRESAIFVMSVEVTPQHRRRYSSGGQSPASHRGGPGSNPGLVMWDFVMDESGAGAGFFRELRFLLPIYIPSASPQSSSLSPEAGTISQEWPQCQ